VIFVFTALPITSVQQQHQLILIGRHFGVKRALGGDLRSSCLRDRVQQIAGDPPFDDVNLSLVPFDDLASVVFQTRTPSNCAPFWSAALRRPPGTLVFITVAHFHELAAVLDDGELSITSDGICFLLASVLGAFRTSGSGQARSRRSRGWTASTDRR
jgi:hypothetical protein